MPSSTRLVEQRRTMAMGFRLALADPSRRRYAILLLVAALLVVKMVLSFRPAWGTAQPAGPQAGAAWQTGRRHASRREAPPPGDNSSYVAACIVVRDEHCDIREWVLHHASLGMGKFYVFDTESSPHMEPVLDDLIASGLVEYEYVTNSSASLSKRGLQPERQGWSINWQRHIYSLCLRRYGGRHKWMAFLDADEFIVLDGGVASLPGLLQPREPHAGVILHWRMFGHSGHMLRPQGGVLSSYTACCDAGWGSRLYKSIVQPALVQEYVSPHNFRFQEGQQAVDTWGRPAPHPDKAQEQESYTGAVLHHYFSKSLYDYNLKMQRRSGDGGSKTLSELIRVGVQCTAECRQAVQLGEQLGQQYDLVQNVPRTCSDQGAAYQALGGPWAKWNPTLPPDLVAPL